MAFIALISSTPSYWVASGPRVVVSPESPSNTGAWALAFSLRIKVARLAAPPVPQCSSGPLATST